MLERGEKGLVDLELLEVSTKKIMNRELLPNEVLIDVAGKSKEKVLQEAIELIDKIMNMKNQVKNYFIRGFKVMN